MHSPVIVMELVTMVTHVSQVCNLYLLITNKALVFITYMYKYRGQISDMPLCWHYAGITSLSASGMMT